MSQHAMAPCARLDSYILTHARHNCIRQIFLLISVPVIIVVIITKLTKLIMTVMYCVQKNFPLCHGAYFHQMLTFFKNFLSSNSANRLQQNNRQTSHTLNEYHVSLRPYFHALSATISDWLNASPTRKSVFAPLYFLLHRVPFYKYCNKYK